MTDRPFLRVALGGNPGNVMFMYMAALKLQRAIDAPTIAHVGIPMFGIDIPDLSTAGLNGLHFTHADELRYAGRVAFDAAAALCSTCPPDFIQLEGFLPTHGEPDPPRPDRLRRPCSHGRISPRPEGRKDELVISIRGGEILRDVQHPHYTQVPAGFYADLIRNTGLKPVFFGQPLGQSVLQ